MIPNTKAFADLGLGAIGWWGSYGCWESRACVDFFWVDAGVCRCIDDKSEVSIGSTSMSRWDVLRICFGFLVALLEVGLS